MTWPWIVVVASLGAVVLAQSIVLVGITTRTTALLERLETRLPATSAPASPAPGTRLPDVDLHTPAGTTMHSSQLRGTPFVLLMTSLHCAPCARLLDQLHEATASDFRTRIVALSDLANGADPPTPPLAWLTTLYQRDGAATRALGADRTPLAIAVDQTGHVIHTQVPNSIQDLMTLADLAANSPPPHRTEPTHRPTQQRSPRLRNQPVDTRRSRQRWSQLPFGRRADRD